MTVIQEKHLYVIIKSDSQIVIQTILRFTKAHNIIANIAANIEVLALTIWNIKFVYHNRYTNTLDDPVAKKAHIYTTQTVFL